jgi:predicted esterase
LEPSDLERLRQPEIVLVAGTADEFLTPKVLASEENRLKQLGARFRSVRFNGGHQLDSPTLAALAGDASG